MDENIKKKCSVIIPVYQAEKYISSTLESCVIQSEYIKEIILVDDFSTDGSWEILLEYQNKYPNLIKVVKNQQKGGNNARNYGFHLSQGDYIQWLDADDTILQGKLKAQINFLETYADVDIAYSGSQLVDFIRENILIRSRLNPARQYEDFLYELLGDNWWLPPHAYLLRRSAALQAALLNGWDSITRIGQDREYFTKVAISGARFGYVPGIFSIYYRRFDTVSVSRAFSNEFRGKETIRLLLCFYEEIQKQGWIKENTKVVYSKILLIQILRNTLLYNVPFNMENNFVPPIDWNTVKGAIPKLQKLDTLIDSLSPQNSCCS